VPTIEGTVQTPLGAAFARRVGARVTLVPVLRAGLGMIDGVLDLLPTARVGHIGLQRDETTALASRYYVKLPPDLDDDVVLVTDPMLATGGSAVAAIDLLRAAGLRDLSASSAWSPRPRASPPSNAATPTCPSTRRSWTAS
jgi:uracil phosphoribosyltransferase